jgi:LPXTG-motif cell wall-anchored protein
MEQWIALAGFAVLLMAGAFLMFRKPSKRDPNNEDRYSGPDGV